MNEMTDWVCSDRNQVWYSWNTSAWLPAANVLLHFAHFRHPRCQSFPMEETFSAIKKNATPQKKNFHQFLKVQPNVNQIFFPCIQRELFMNLNQAFIWHLLKWHPFTYPILLPAAGFLSLFLTWFLRQLR